MVVALIRERDERFDGSLDCVDHPTSATRLSSAMNSLCEYFIADYRFNPAALQIVVPAIERYCAKAKSSKKSVNDVCYPLITRRPVSRAICSSFAYTSGGEMHFHCFGSFLRNTVVHCSSEA